MGQNHSSIWLTPFIKDLWGQRSFKNFSSFDENNLINENIILMANKLIFFSISKRTDKYDKENKKLSWVLSLMKKHVNTSVSMLVRNFLIGEYLKLEYNLKHNAIRNFFAVSKQLKKIHSFETSPYNSKISSFDNDSKSRKKISISTFYHMVRSYDFFHHVRASFLRKKKAGFVTYDGFEKMQK